MTLVSVQRTLWQSVFGGAEQLLIQEAHLLGALQPPEPAARAALLRKTIRLTWVRCFTAAPRFRLREEKPSRLTRHGSVVAPPMLFGAIKTIHDEGHLHRDISLDKYPDPDNVPAGAAGLRPVAPSVTSSDENRKPCCVRLCAYRAAYDDNESGRTVDGSRASAQLRTLIVGHRRSCVGAFHSGYLQPLAEIQPQGYSRRCCRLSTVPLALHMEDRPQSIDEFGGVNRDAGRRYRHALTAKKPGTMLVPVEEEGHRLRRLTGVVTRSRDGCRGCAGCGRWRDAVQRRPRCARTGCASAGSIRTTKTASNAPDVKPETAKVSETSGNACNSATDAATGWEASPIALVCIRILDGGR